MLQRACPSSNPQSPPQGSMDREEYQIPSISSTRAASCFIRHCSMIMTSPRLLHARQGLPSLAIVMRWGCSFSDNIPGGHPRTQIVVLL